MYFLSSNVVTPYSRFFREDILVNVNCHCYFLEFLLTVLLRPYEYFWLLASLWFPLHCYMVLVAPLQQVGLAIAHLLTAREYSQDKCFTNTRVRGVQSCFIQWITEWGHRVPGILRFWVLCNLWADGITSTYPRQTSTVSSFFLYICFLLFVIIILFSA